MISLKIFKRSTNSISFIPEVDGLRFIAIVTVVIFHLNSALLRQHNISLKDWSELIGKVSCSQLEWWFIRLDLGVKVFFSISGFILAIPFLRTYFFDSPKIKVRDYLYRRLTRLEPPFVISLLFFYLGQIFVWKQDWLALLPNLISGLLYSHVLFFGEPNPINPVSWSLETEAQFYLLLPLLAFFVFNFRKHYVRTVLFLSLIIGSIFLRGFSLQYGINQISSSILVYFVNFSTGILFAVLYLKNTYYFKKGRGFIYDGLFLVSFFALFYFYKPQVYWLNNVLFNIAVFLVFLSVFKGRITNWIFTRPFLYLIGGMCYSIYLIHYALLHFLVKITVGITLGMGYWFDFFLQFLLLFPMVLAVSAMFYLLVEKPCMDKNWPRQLKAWIIKLVKTNF